MSWRRGCPVLFGFIVHTPSPLSLLGWQLQWLLQERKEKQLLLPPGGTGNASKEQKAPMFVTDHIFHSYK